MIRIICFDVIEKYRRKRLQTWTKTTWSPGVRVLNEVKKISVGDGSSRVGVWDNFYIMVLRSEGMIEVLKDF